MKESFYQLRNKEKDIYCSLYIHKIGHFKYNWHKDIELNIILKGTAEFCVEGKKYILEEDDMIIIDSNRGHATLSYEQDTIAMVMHVDTKFFQSYVNDYNDLCFGDIVRKNDVSDKTAKAIKYLLAVLIFKFIESPLNKQLEKDTIFYLIMQNIIRYICNEEKTETSGIKSATKDKKMNKVLDYIELHHSDKITLNTIADIMGYHPSYVSQFFKNNIGINFYEYLTRVRIREATFELIKTDLPISEIALKHGFSDIKSFNVNFKENFGRSPKEYRKEVSFLPDMKDAKKAREFLKEDNNDVKIKLEEYENLLTDSLLFMTKKKECEIQDLIQFNNYKNKITQLEEQVNELTQKLKSIQKVLL